MGSKIIGANIQLGGEKEYREALSRINNEQKELNSEMKLSSATFKDNQNSLDALKNKHEILTKQIEEQVKKVDIYKKAVEDSTKKEEDAAKKVADLQDAYQKAQKKMEDMKDSTSSTKDEIKKQQSVIDELKGKLELSEKGYKTAETAASNYKISLNNASASLLVLKDDLSKTDKYMEEAESSTDKCATSIDNMGKKIGGAKTETLTFGDVLKANLASGAILAGVDMLGSAIGNVASKMVELTTAAAGYADDIMTTSTITGVSTDNLQAYAYMAELTDTSLETIAGSMAKNIRSMSSAQKGTEDMVNAYETLNVQFTDGNGKLRDSEAVYWDVVDALGGIKDETERDSISMQIFGKSALELNTLIAQGSTGVKKFTDEAKSMGAILDTDTLNSLGSTDDAMQRFTQTVEIAKRKVGAEMAPAMEEAMSKISEEINDVSDDVADFAGGALESVADAFVFIVENSDLVIAGISGIATATMANKLIVPVVETLVAAWVAHKSATEGATIAQWALNAAENANPIGLLVTAIAGATGALITFAQLNKDTEDATSNLVKKHQDEIDTLKKSMDEMDNANEKRGAEITTIQNLRNELAYLNEKEKLSTDEKARMSSIVNQLNEAIPDLNLAINEQTGYLTENTEEMEKLVDANINYLKVSAAKEDLQEIAKQQYDAEVELNQVLKDKSEAIALATKLQEEYNKQTADGSPPLYTLMAGLATAQGEVEDLGNQEIELKNTMSDLDQKFADTQTYIDNYSNSVKQSGDNQITYMGQIIQVSDETAQKIRDLQVAYAEAKVTAQDSIKAQVGLFDELKVASDLSAQQMANNLKSQTDAYKQYKDDLIAANDLVAKGLLNDGLLKSIEEMGISGAGYLHELVDASKGSGEELSKVMTEYFRMQQARSTLSDTIANIQTDYELGMNQLVVDSQNTTNNIATSIASGAPVAAKSSATLASASLASMCTTLGILEGHSTKAEELGTAVGNSFASGLTNSSSAVNSAMNSLVQGAINNVDVSGLTAKVDKALGSKLK